MSRSSQEVENAIAWVDSSVERSVRFYPKDLPAHHHARLTHWIPGPRIETAKDFLKLEPVARVLEVNRAHAESLLVQERLGGPTLDIKDRELLVRRALGIAPNAEERRFQEIMTCPDLNPVRVAASSGQLLTAYETLARCLNPATALAYCGLVAAGITAPTHLLRYGAKIDRLFDRVTSAPSVIQALDHAMRVLESRPVPGQIHTASDAGFQSLLGILLAVHEQLWALKPQRASSPFLLSQVVDNYLGGQRGVGNSLGLALVDSIIIGKLGFGIRHHIDSDVVYLEVMVHNRSVYWEVTRRSTLSFVPITSGERLEIDDFIARIFSSRAAVMFLQGRVDKAIELYEQVREVRPESAETCNNLGLCYIRKRLPKKAVECINRAIQIEPGSAEAYHNLGNAYVTMERWPRAIEAFKKAISLRADYVEAYNNLGFALHRSGSPEQAAASFQAAAELRPEYAQAHFNLGNIRLEQRRFDDAIKCYRTVAQLQPRMAQAHYNMGQAFYQKGKLDPAIACYRKAIGIEPKHFGAWHNLGIAYRDKGMKDKAVEALERAVTLNPNLIR